MVRKFWFLVSLFVVGYYLSPRLVYPYYGGFTSSYGSSLWASVVPGLCSSCAKYQSWEFVDVNSSANWSRVTLDPYGKVYWQRSGRNGVQYLVSTKPGSAVAVSHTLVNGQLVIRVDYSDLQGRSAFLKQAVVVQWKSSVGTGAVYTWGPEQTMPGGIVDNWVSTFPATSRKVYSGASVCGEAGYFRVKKSC